MARALTNISMRLEDALLPGAPGYKPPLLLAPQYGYVPQSISLGHLDVREVVNKRPSANGTFDYTGLYGSRAVSANIGLAAEIADGSLYPDLVGLYDSDLEDRLKAWTDPGARSYLYWKRDTMRSERRILIRGAAQSMPIQFAKSQFDYVTMGFKAPEGTSEDAFDTSITIYAGGTTEFGRSYDLSFDRTYPDSPPIGAGLITNLGNTKVLPTVTFYGPCTQPRFANDTTGQKFEMKNTYGLVAGEYLVVNFKEGTVLKNGDINANDYDKVDFNVSTWWSIIPKTNSLRFYPLTQSSPSNAFVTFRGQYI
jgi:hypothetical protein